MCDFLKVRVLITYRIYTKPTIKLEGLESDVLEIVRSQLGAKFISKIEIEYYNEDHNNVE